MMAEQLDITGAGQGALASVSLAWVGILVLLIVMPAMTEAACSQPDVACAPVSVQSSGSRISRGFDLDFVTKGQSLRRKGEADAEGAPQERFTIPLLRSSRATFDGEAESFGKIYKFCLYSKLGGMLSGMELFGLDLGEVVDRFEEAFSNRCYSFGGTFDGRARGNFGLQLFGSTTEGSVDLTYPLSLTLSHPDADQFNPGDEVIIETMAVERPGADIAIHSPGATLGLRVSGSLRTHGTIKGCRFDECNEKSLWDLRLKGRRRIPILDGEAGATLGLGDGSLASDILAMLLGLEGDLSVPDIQVLNERIEQGVLSGSGSDSYVDLVVDVDSWLLNVVGRLGKVKNYFNQRAQMAYKVVNFLFNLLVIDTRLQLIKHQAIQFDPEFRIRLRLSSSVQWDILENSEVTDSGEGDSVVLVAGQSLRIHTDEAALPLTVVPSLSQKNRFRNREWAEIATGTDITLLDVHIERPPLTVFIPRCIDLWVGEICTGSYKWNGFSLDFGPAFQASDIWAASGNWPVVFDQSWELQGFQTFSLEGFVLEANAAPVVSDPIGPRFLQWNQRLDIALDQHFSDEDGQPLSFAAFGLPDFLTVQGGRLQGTADGAFSGEITIEADDGHGGKARHGFPLTVVMPLARRRQVAVAEGQAVQLEFRLSARPDSTVTLQLTPDNDQVDLGGGPGGSVTLAFDGSDWNQYKTVSVTAVEDMIDENGDSSHIQLQLSSSDARFAGASAEAVLIAIADNDRAGIRNWPGSLLVNESGTSDDLKVRLTSEPVEPVTLSFTLSDSSEFEIVGASSLVFDASNWNVYQNVTLAGVDDTVVDGTQEGWVEITASSADAFYDARSRRVKIRNGDDDQAGVSLLPVSGLRTTEAVDGTDATFRVVLDSQPVPAAAGDALVTISLAASDATEGSVSPASLTFTQSNWSTPQLVTLDGVDDGDADGDKEWSVVTSISVVNETTYAGLSDSDVADVTVTNIDDEQAGLLVAANDPLWTGEDGSSASFRVRLRSRPTADVAVTLASSNTAEGVLDRSSLLFTPDDFAIEQTVVATGVDEETVDGDIDYSVTLAASSDDPFYQGALAVLPARNRDDDVPGVTVTPYLGLKVTETGGTDNFTVVLDARPAAPVVIPIASEDNTEGVATPASLTFTPDDWHQPQEVTVQGLPDMEEDGDAVFYVRTGPAQSSGPYDGVDPENVEVLNYGADSAAILLSARGSLAISEKGGKALFSVQLGTMPLANVSVRFSLDDGLQGEVTPSQLIFTPENWNLPRVVTFTARDNALIDGDRAVQLAAQSVAGSGSPYAGLLSGSFAITIADDDVAGVAVTPVEGLFTDESGASAEFTVVLLAAPDSSVTIPVQSSDASEGVPDTSALVFTPATWALPQTVTVRGQDDALADDEQTYRIQLMPAASDDRNYRDLDADDVTLINEDDDEPGVMVTPATGLETSEGGDAAKFAVVLQTQPEMEIQIALNLDGADEVRVDPQTLRFGPSNWNRPQEVTLTGVDDDEWDGDQPYQVRLNLDDASVDSTYGAVDLPIVEGINRDNEQLQLVLEEPQDGLITDENGTQARFWLRLSGRPSTPVSFQLRVTDATEGALLDGGVPVTQMSLVMAPDQWNQPRELLLQGVDDSLYDDDQVFEVAVEADSNDPVFAGMTPLEISVINQDNDYDPTGYFYHAETGDLVSGGQVAANCTDGAVVRVVSGKGGESGSYQLVPETVPETTRCRLEIQPPAGYRIDVDCPASQDPLVLPEASLPLSLGSSPGEGTSRLADAGCGANPWYRELQLTAGSARLLNNNVPLERDAYVCQGEILVINGAFAGEGKSTILSSNQGVETALPQGLSRVSSEVVGGHMLVLKAPRVRFPQGSVFRVAAGARLVVSGQPDSCRPEN